MIKRTARSLVLLAVVVVTAFASAKGKGPGGVIAASVGNTVVVADPATGRSATLRTGPVAWLFPAPGGVLYAPDLVNSKTSVIDLRTQTVGETIQGVTMPHFGSLSDRYVVVGRKMLVMSYPERAVMKRLEASFKYPWQVEVLVGNTIAMVLDRHPEGEGEVSLTAVKLDEGRVVYNQLLAGDVRHFALSEELAVLALADAGNRQVLLVQPATLAPIAAFKVDGQPLDLIFAGDGSTLAVAISDSAGGGELKLWKIKPNKQNGLELAKNWTLPLAGSPQRLAASPDGRYLAVGSNGGYLEVFDVDRREKLTTIELSEAPRDVVWCDPSIEGPVLPDWSDEKPPELGLGAGS